MIEEQKLIVVTAKELVEKAGEFHREGYRLVQIGCTKLAESLEINYSFDKGYQFVNLRVEAPVSGAVIPSVSGVYWSAFLYENEMHDLYGVTVEGMALDYKGTFYRTTVKWPFNPGQEKKEGA